MAIGRTNSSSQGFPNGREWEVCSSMQFSCYSVCYAKGIWIAATEDGIYCSYDSKTWSRKATGEFYHVICAGSTFLIAGSNGVFYSQNGVNWNSSEVTDSCNYLVAGKDRYIAARTSGGLYYSTPAQPQGWTLISGVTSYTFDKLYYFHGKYFATTSNDGLWVSNTGTSWTTCIPSGKWYCVGWDGMHWFAGGSKSGGGLFYSSDASTWTQVTEITATNVYDFSYGDTGWVIATNSGVYYSNYTILTGWTRSNIADGRVSKMCYANGVWVGGGEEDQVLGVFYSLDGAHTWAETQPSPSGYIRTIYNANGIWITGSSIGLYRSVGFEAS